jgi:hypothetical protein
VRRRPPIDRDGPAPSFEAILRRCAAEFIQEMRADQIQYTFTAPTQEVASVACPGSAARPARSDLEAIECEYQIGCHRRPTGSLTLRGEVARWLGVPSRREPGSARPAYREAVTVSSRPGRGHLPEARNDGPGYRCQLETSLSLTRTETSPGLPAGQDLAVTLEIGRLARVLALEGIYLRAALELDRRSRPGNELTIATDLGDRRRRSLAMAEGAAHFPSEFHIVWRHLRVVDALVGAGGGSAGSTDLEDDP